MDEACFRQHNGAAQRRVAHHPEILLGGGLAGAVASQRQPAAQKATRSVRHDRRLWCRRVSRWVPRSCFVATRGTVADVRSLSITASRRGSWTGPESRSWLRILLQEMPRETD